MKLGVTQKRIGAFLLVSLLSIGSFHTIRPDSTLEKCALGALAAVGVGAVGCLAWNADFYSAENYLDRADRDDQDLRNRYECMLRLASSACQHEMLELIRKEYRHFDHGHDLRHEYPLLWYIDRLSGDVSRLREVQNQLSDYAYRMRKSASYYRKLRAQRDVVAERVAQLLARLQPVLNVLLALPEYAQQEQAYRIEKDRREREYRREQERKKINAFKYKLSEVRATFQGISSDFAGEYNQLMALTAFGDFELCLSSIISNKYVTFNCYTTQRSRYAALWYEERIIDAIRSLERAYRDLNDQHRAVCTCEQYDAYGLEYEYTQLMSRLNDHLVRLRDIRDRLPRTHFYVADLRAYEYACREYNLSERERNARQREYEADRRAREARDAEHAARQRERDADRRVRDAQDAEREADRARQVAEVERQNEYCRRVAQEEQERLRQEREQEVLREKEQRARDAQKMDTIQQQQDEAHMERDISIVGGW